MCEDLAVALAKRNPYQRKAVFEEALLRWDLETKHKMSSSASNQGLWVKMESFALTVLLMRSVKNGLTTSAGTARMASHLART